MRSFRNFEPARYDDIVVDETSTFNYGHPDNDEPDVQSIAMPLEATAVDLVDKISQYVDICELGLPLSLRKRGAMIHYNIMVGQLRHFPGEGFRGVCTFRGSGVHSSEYVSTSAGVHTTATQLRRLGWNFDVLGTSSSYDFINDLEELVHAKLNDDARHLWRRIHTNGTSGKGPFAIGFVFGPAGPGTGVRAEPPSPGWTSRDRTRTGETLEVFQARGEAAKKTS